MATKFDIEKFNGRNFSLWKLKMKVILRKDGCLAAINERPVDFSDENKWIEMDGNAMANFHLALADELTSLSCKIVEQERAELLLQSLPNSYDQLIINLTNSNVTSLVFDDVAAVVLQEENRLKNKEVRQVNMQQAEALPTMRGTSIECGQSSSHKHGRSKSRNKKNLKCYNYGKKGHLKKDCWSLNKNSNPQGNTANTLDDGGALCCEASTTVEGGCVYSCNDHALEIIGVGTIKLMMYDETVKVVRDVRHVKGQKKNLLSYGLLDNNASKIETRKGIMKVFRGALVVLKGEKIAGNLYILKGETLLEAEASVASSRVELDSGNKIKYFRIENGGEYTSKEFDDFCRKEGIKRQFTVANTPQQNGVAERMNRTLLERTRAMLRDAGLEKSFWAEAVNTACYLVNRAPSTAIELRTPMEMWDWKCKFLGYADGVKGYRLWDPTARKVIISRDVIFVEDKLQRKEDDDSTEKSETTQIHVDKEVEQDGEPSTFQEAISSSDASLWMMAMHEEIEALHKNNTWDLVPLPQGRKPIGNKWVFKIKRNGDDQVERYRARLVVKGYAQKEEQLDVKIAFLHGNLEEEIYMLQPEGFEEKKKEELGLQVEQISVRSKAGAERSGDNDFVILLLYVDDMLVAGPNKYHIEELKAQLAREFENEGLGISKQDSRDANSPRQNMSPSSEEERMEMSRVPYASTVGSLMFAMICTRPDTAQAVGVVSRYIANPGKEHWNTVKRILRYIKGTLNVTLCYGGSNLLINGYVDSDYARDLDKIVATSTTEAEYVEATQASKEAIWLKMLLEELGHNQEYVSLFCDSQRALHLARNPAFHSRTKHIRVQYHFIREKVEELTVDMQKIHTKDNIADFMTKAINEDKFTWCRSSCGLSETIHIDASSEDYKEVFPERLGNFCCSSSCNSADISSRAMETEDGGGVDVVGRVEIDTRAPFQSVKEAVALFGEKVLVGEIYANRIKEMKAQASESGKGESKIAALTAELAEIKQSLQQAEQENNSMLYAHDEVIMIYTKKSKGGPENIEKKTRSSPKIMKSGVFCMPGFKGNNKSNRLSPTTLLEQFREAVFRLIMISALSKDSHHHHSSTSNAPRIYYPADAHHSEAVADCIEFIKKKSSRMEDMDSRAGSSNMDATNEIVMPVPVM
ncbi:hypothetical protein F3Y22_tig00110733pilonHSYRG00089 [Hibiscus syriacus]|uniref:Integrase catalytic domain-containing protein n=1 Tax=Hibiscus syriacus TaxID=106335 RepID=A0A6A2ZSU1_HIBSY|nr:hypothetical protein F3Y22_tig00110733pilonHSYRG00089 [Hibiscus syriacus]